MSDQNELDRYFKQQAELFPDDYYIPPEQKVTSAKDDHKMTNYSPENPSYEPQETGNLSAYEEQINQCKRCSLGESRINFVFGIGSPTADLMFIGEAPGQQEDEQGEPFVGRAGKLLDKILAAIDLKREEVFIANVLKCRPPNNRDPKPDEIEECEPYLVQQIQMIQPKVIIALGRIAANTLLKESMALRDMRNKTWNYHGTDLVATYHPAALLRNPKLKRPAWEDFQRVQEKYLD